jgi:hypothetical protein
VNAADQQPSSGEGFPPIATEDVSGHLAGQYTSGPLRYVVFSDALGPVGALWMATAPGDEAAGWEPNRSHPDAVSHRGTWRPRITAAQGRPSAPDYDPDAEGGYSAAKFFARWTSPTAGGALDLASPHDFAGGSAALAAHLGWA